MAHVINLKGNKYGRLTVIDRNNIKGNRRQVRWDCICECGNSHTVTGESLRSGKSKSCGCLLKESRCIKNKNTDRQTSMLKLVYSSLKKRHKQKFNNDNYIGFELFCKLSLSNCYYCGSEPKNTQHDIRYETKYGQKQKLLITDFILRYNGIDRKDSKIGYIKNNVLPCCKDCNSAKMELSVIDFKNQIIKIYNHWAMLH